MIVQNIDLVAAPAVAIAAGLVAAVARQTIVNELTNKFELLRLKTKIVTHVHVIPYAYGGPIGEAICSEPDSYWMRLWDAVRGR